MQSSSLRTGWTVLNRGRTFLLNRGRAFLLSLLVSLLARILAAILGRKHRRATRGLSRRAAGREGWAQRWATAAAHRQGLKNGGGVFICEMGHVAARWTCSCKTQEGEAGLRVAVRAPAREGRAEAVLGFRVGLNSTSFRSQRPKARILPW